MSLLSFRQTRTMKSEEEEEEGEGELGADGAAACAAAERGRWSSESCNQTAQYIPSNSP